MQADGCRWDCRPIERSESYPTTPWVEFRDSGGGRGEVGIGLAREEPGLAQGSAESCPPHHGRARSHVVLAPEPPPPVASEPTGVPQVVHRDHASSVWENIGWLQFPFMVRQEQMGVEFEWEAEQMGGLDHPLDQVT